MIQKTLKKYNTEARLNPCYEILFMLVQVLHSHGNLLQDFLHGYS